MFAGFVGTAFAQDCVDARCETRSVNQGRSKTGTVMWCSTNSPPKRYMKITADWTFTRSGSGYSYDETGSDETTWDIDGNETYHTEGEYTVGGAGNCNGSDPCTTSWDDDEWTNTDCDAHCSNNHLELWSAASAAAAEYFISDPETSLYSILEYDSDCDELTEDQSHHWLRASDGWEETQEVHWVVSQEYTTAMLKENVLKDLTEAVSNLGSGGWGVSGVPSAS